MRCLTLKIRQVVALAAPLLFANAPVFAAPVTQIGFAIDGSSSVSTSDFNLQLTGLSSAFSILPTDSTVEVTVVQFTSSAQLEVGPTLLDSGTTKTNLINQTTGIGQSFGGTVPGAGIDLLTTELTGSSNFGDDSIINVSTDGGFFVSAAQTSASSAKTAGIDALTGEAIGSGANEQNLKDIVFGPNSSPGDGSGQILVQNASPPDPLASGVDPWVVPVSDFQAFGDVLQAKVQASVPGAQIPVPSTVLLMVLGISTIAGGQLLMRRRVSVYGPVLGHG